MAWEHACRAHYKDEVDDDHDPTVLEFVELNKANGIQPCSMKDVRASVGHEREDWRQAMQIEVDSLRGNQTFLVATAAELRKVHYRDILPMKMVMGVKRECQLRDFASEGAGCGVQQLTDNKEAGEDLYATKADITSVRAVLAASVPKTARIAVTGQFWDPPGDTALAVAVLRVLLILLSQENYRNLELI